MAISATMKWEVRAGASAGTHGGGFNGDGSSPGTDYSQNDNSQVDFDGATVTASNGAAGATITLTGHTVVAADNRNVLNITAGTNFTAGRYEIISVDTGANTWTLDRNCTTGAGSAMTGSMGGALQSLTRADLVAVAGNEIHVKAGTYGETLTLTVSGGNGTQRHWIGYNATRNDAPTGANRPLIDGASTRANCIVIGATFGNLFENLRFTGATAAGVTLSTGGAAFRNCRSYTQGTHGWAGTGNSGLSYLLIDCEADDNAGSGLSLTGTNAVVRTHGCYFHDNAASGIAAGSSNNTLQVIANCIFDTNASSGAVLFTHSVVNCTAYGNTGASSDGFSWGGNIQHQAFCYNCISASNGRDGFRRASAAAINVIFDYNDYDANSGADLTNITAGAHDSSADPQFTSAAAGDFSIGTNLKALGWPGAFPGGLSTSYLDMGAVQRQEAGAGGGMLRNPGTEGGCNA